MRVILPIVELERHSARSRKMLEEMAEERSARNVLSEADAKKLDGISMHYAYVIGPNLNAQLRGVTSVSLSGSGINSAHSPE